MFHSWLNSENTKASWLTAQISTNSNCDQGNLTGQLKRALINLETGHQEQAVNNLKAIDWGFELHNRNNHYQDLLERAPVDDLLLEQDLCLLEENKSAANLVGCDPGESKHRSLPEINQPNGLDSLCKHYPLAVQGQTGKSERVNLRCNDGIVCLLWMSSTPFSLWGVTTTLPAPCPISPSCGTKALA